jgi:ribonuclease P protein component
LKGTIKSRREFDAAYAHGRRAHGPHVVLFLLPREKAREVLGDRFVDETRFGVVASRRVGNAVARNRAKRVLRAALRDVNDLFPASSRVVLVARRSLVRDGARSPELATELRGLLERCDLPEGDSR